MVKTYSKSAQGGQKLSAHFKVAEFASKDGSDYVMVDDELVRLLEQIRVWAEAPVKITSGYRTFSHNRAVGGASNSFHTKGQAADIVVSGKTPAEVAKFAQAIGANGVGLYTASRFVHIDTRIKRYYWKNVGGGSVTVSSHGGICPFAKPSTLVRRGKNGDGVRWVQWWLRLWGFALNVDGSFGKNTDAAVRAFQKQMGLTVDGIVGNATKNALKGII